MSQSILDSFFVELGYNIGSGESEKLKEFLGSAARVFSGHTVDLNKVLSDYTKKTEEASKKTAKATKDTTEETEAGGKKLIKQFGGVAAASVEHTATIVRNLAVWQVAAVGTFNAVGLGVIGIADSVANADQRYRLFGERMFMSTAAVRGMDIATKALGATMDQIAWDPELRGRFNELTGIEGRMGASMGPGFEADLKRIRDIRFEFAKLRVELSYIVPIAVTDLFKMLGTGPDTVLARLQRLNTWIVSHGQEISQELAQYVLPVFHDWESIMKNLGGLAEHVGQALLTMIGIFSGDSGLQQGQVSLANIGKALDHISHGVAFFVNGMTTAVDGVVRLAMALEHVVAAGLALTHLDFAGFKRNLGEAGGDVKAMVQDITSGSGMVGGIALGGGVGAGLGTWGGAEAGAALGSVFGPAGTAIGGILGGIAGSSAGGLLGSGAGGAAGYGLGRLANGSGIGFSATGASKALASSNVDWGAAARPYGIDPNMLKAFALTESGGRGFDRNGNVIVNSTSGARGMFQLMPGVAKQYGVNPDDPQQAASGAAHLFSDLLRRYHGNIGYAVEAYNDGAGNLDRHLRDGSLPNETANYLPTWERNYAAASGKAPQQTFHMTFNVPPGVSPYEYADQVSKKLQSRQNMDMFAAYLESDGVWANG